MFLVHFDFDYNAITHFLTFIAKTIESDSHSLKKIDLTPHGPAGGNPYVELTVRDLDTVKSIYSFYHEKPWTDDSAWSTWFSTYVKPL